MICWLPCAPSGSSGEIYPHACMHLPALCILHRADADRYVQCANACMRALVCVRVVLTNCNDQPEPEQLVWWLSTEPV